MGGVSGVITAGIGSIFGAVGSGATSFLGKAGWELARAGAHGFAQGGLSMLQGGDFGSGFLSGALGSLGGSLFQSVGGSFAKSTVGTIAFSSFSGGVGSALSGGSFLQGAITGAVIGGLNHAMHNLSNNFQTNDQERSKLEAKTDKNGQTTYFKNNKQITKAEYEQFQHEFYDGELEEVKVQLVEEWVPTGKIDTIDYDERGGFLKYQEKFKLITKPAPIQPR